MTINRATLYQAFKYALYFFLTMNVIWFFIEEFAANKLLYPTGVSLLQIYDAYTATIDTAAWVVLLLMFELETYILDDDQFTRPVTLSLHTVRVISYAMIVRAFFGYIESLGSVLDVSVLAGVADLCSLAAENWSYSHDFEEYTLMTAANCSSFSTAESFLVFADARAVVDAAGHTAIVWLAWVDVINAGVWLLVVLVLEIDIRLQEHGRYEGLALQASPVTKFMLYAILICAFFYWLFFGDFVDWWDALLWLLAFFFIEMNVVEWRQETLEEKAATSGNNVN